MADVANLVVALKLQDGLSSGLGKISGQLNRMDRPLSRMGRGVGQVASGLDRMATRAAVAAAGGLTAVITTAASFEQAWTGVEKTVGGNLDALEADFRQMAREMPIAFEELAGIGEAGGALGIAKEDLLDFTDVVARLGVSTNLSSDEAATALGQLGNVLHLTGDDFRDFADSLVALGNDGASTEKQIVEMAARFGAAGNSAGLSKEEILALSSAVASMGIEVEAGGGALSRIFGNIATNIGTSSGKAKAFAKVLGLSAGEFKRAWERDALGTLQNFLKQLNKLDQFEQARVLKSVGIVNQRDVNAVRLMAQNIGFVGDQLDVARNAQGALDKESQKFFDTAMGQWKTMVNNIRDAGVTIGNELLPTFKDLVKEFTGFLNRPGTRNSLKQFGQDLAKGIKGLVTELKGTDFSGIIDGMKLAASVAKGAFDAFRSLPQPIQQLAIAALVANKVSGGAVGQIARGLGNIALGGGGLLGLGRTPATAMWVRQVGGPLGGGPGVGAPGGGFWGGVGKVLGLAAAVTIGAELGRFIGGAVFDPTVAPAVEFERSQFSKFIEANAGNRAALERGLGAVEDGIYQIAGNTVDGLERWLIPQIGVLEEQRDTLRDLLARIPPERERNLVPTNLGGTPGTPMPVRITNPKDVGKDSTGEDEAARAIRQGLAKLTLEQRLISDKNFRRTITSQAQFLRILRRTSEFGEAGKGTSIERGPKTGRDPLGDAFVALVKRVPKNLLTGEIYREVSNHIIALEEVQRGLIAEGKTDAARHAQRNIDKLAALINTVDRTRPILERTRDHTRGAEAQSRLAAQRMGFVEGLERQQVGLQQQIRDKKTSFTANLYTTLSTYVNASLIQERIVQQRLSAGTGFGPGLP